MNPVLLSGFFDATSGFRWVITEARRFPDVSVVKNLPAISGDTGDAGLVPESILGLGRFPWRRAWQPTPVFFAWRTPCTEDPGGLQSMGLHRVRHD